MRLGSLWLRSTRTNTCGLIALRSGRFLSGMPPRRGDIPVMRVGIFPDAIMVTAFAEARGPGQIRPFRLQRLHADRRSPVWQDRPEHICGEYVPSEPVTGLAPVSTAAMMRRKWNTERSMIARRLLLQGALALPAFRGARAAEMAAPVRIGALFPLTGISAASGGEARAAIEIGCDIINAAHPELPGLPLAATVGLPNLGGARVEPVFADHRGDAAMAASEAQRLISDGRIAALFGAYQSSAALTATAVAEQASMPFVVGDSVAADITARGFKWIFRVTPIASTIADTYLRFLGDMKAAGKSIANIAIVNENSEYGISVGDAVAAAAQASGVPVAIRIPYMTNSTDVSAQVLQLKQKNPSVVILIGYAPDAILLMRTLKSLNYLPAMIIGDSTGFSDPGFIPAVGDISQGLMNRSAWSLGPPGSLSAGVNSLYKAKTGHDMSDVPGRVMQAWLVLADAINRAGSIEPAKIRQALAETNLPRSAMLVGYRGVRFDQTGQNVESATYLTQLQGRDYVTTWPDLPGNARQIWPMAGWNS